LDPEILLEAAPAMHVASANFELDVRHSLPETVEINRMVSSDFPIGAVASARVFMDIGRAKTQ
jgi:hypothetical protein